MKCSALSKSQLMWYDIGYAIWFLLWFKQALCYLCLETVTFANSGGGNKNVRFHTVYPNKYAHGFVVLCFIVVIQSFIMNSHEVFIHIHQGCFAGTRAIVRLPQCQWSKPDGYGKISQCIIAISTAKQNRVHISWDILYYCLGVAFYFFFSCHFRLSCHS